MKTHAFVICWPGKELDTIKINKEIINYVDKLTIIYSTKDDSTIKGDGNWHKVSDEWFYGKKFYEILNLFKEDILIQIHADTHYHNWKGLIESCKNAFLLNDIGLWAPDFNNTAWDLESVVLRKNGISKYYDVCQTDCIIWALNKTVCNRMRQFDYTQNNLGWGIDWAAICFCYCNNLRVIRDPSIFVDHHKGTGYGYANATAQMNLFLSQMSIQEKNILEILNSKIIVTRGNK